MTKTVVISQSNYIPWRGYFDLIRQADQLILLDSVQYTRRDWRNHNIIRTANGPQWLTIPVDVKGKYRQSIDAAKIAEPGWAEKHIRAIEVNYRRATAFTEVSPWLFVNLRMASGHALLSDSNQSLIAAFCSQLSIGTPIERCTHVIARDELKQLTPSERLARLCEAVGGTRYLSGPAARSYLDTACFSDRGIEVAWMSYDGYREYPQCWPGFDPKVSIVDVLLNCGFKASIDLIGR
jgi:hypothetical protein